MKESGFGEARTKNNRFWNGIRLIGLDAVPTSEVEEVSSTSPISQSDFAQNGSTLEVELNERLRRELHGGWTYQQL